MRYSVVAFAALSACASSPTQGVQPVAANPADMVEALPAGFGAQQVESDLEGAIVERFGADALKRACTAEAYVQSRHYQGLPRPPEAGKPPRPPIAALLIRERNIWLRAESGGTFRPLGATQQERLVTALADTGPWAEPTFAAPTCTDAGATYLIVSLPDRPFLLRAANCATPKSEQLGLTAINI